jgi:hypothetical protein
MLSTLCPPGVPLDTGGCPLHALRRKRQESTHQLKQHYDCRATSWVWCKVLVHDANDTAGHACHMQAYNWAVRWNSTTYDRHRVLQHLFAASQQNTVGWLLFCVIWIWRRAVSFPSGSGSNAGNTTVAPCKLVSVGRDCSTMQAMGHDTCLLLQVWGGATTTETTMGCSGRCWGQPTPGGCRAASSVALGSRVMSEDRDACHRAARPTSDGAGDVPFCSHCCFHTRMPISWVLLDGIRVAGPPPPRSRRATNFQPMLQRMPSLSPRQLAVRGMTTRGLLVPLTEPDHA